MQADQPASDQNEHDGRTQTASHLFVDEMKTFKDPSHAKHLVRRSTLWQGAILVGPEDSGYSRRVGGMPARPDGAGARLNSSDPSMTASGVRREKAALSSGCESHPANAPAGSNRSS